ncbi:MAG: HDOD domain-containing protein [Proteobacteria bacterium]|nr:HDOD domain-containing protein [Pseudomonadota bacterium]
MKILIVDDDFVSRSKMKTILQSMGACTDDEHAASALRTFEQALDTGQPFNLITLDIHMPGMDGTEMLFKIRELEKKRHIPEPNRVKVFMVTSQSDKGSLITCLQAGCNGFIVKPFTQKTLLQKFSSQGITIDVDTEPVSKTNHDAVTKSSQSSDTQRKKLIQDVSSALKGDRVDLPSLPDINTRLKEMVNKEIDFSEITTLLKKDMLIASSLISLSNSALFKGINQSKTLEEAIGRLGIDQTYLHVEMLCQRALYSNVPKKYTSYVEKLWNHAQTCAYCSQYIAEQLNLKLREDAFTLGLVHDIGKLILLQIISKLEEVGPTGEDVDQSVLFSTLDTYHGEFGAALLNKWGFSDIFDKVARHHNHPEIISNPSKELLLVGFANQLVNHLDKTKEELYANTTAVFCLKQLNIESKTIEDIRSGLIEILNEMVSG